MLPYQRASARAERAPHRELVLSPFGPHEKEVHDVRARDEQHARHRPEDDPQHSTDVANHHVAQWLHHGSHANLLDGRRRQPARKRLGHEWEQSLEIRGRDFG
jgi:hypothetical protein